MYADNSGAMDFKRKFRRIVEIEKLMPEQVYNMNQI